MPPGVIIGFPVEKAAEMNDGGSPRSCPLYD